MTKQTELQQINEQLEDLMQKGSNDERLVTRKRELEKELRFVEKSKEKFFQLKIKCIFEF